MRCVYYESTCVVGHLVMLHTKDARVYKLVSPHPSLLLLRSAQSLYKVITTDETLHRIHFAYRVFRNVL